MSYTIAPESPFLPVSCVGPETPTLFIQTGEQLDAVFARMVTTEPIGVVDKPLPGESGGSSLASAFGRNRADPVLKMAPLPNLVLPDLKTPEENQAFADKAFAPVDKPTLFKVVPYLTEQNERVVSATVVEDQTIARRGLFAAAKSRIQGLFKHSAGRPKDTAKHRAQPQVQPTAAATSTENWDIPNPETANVSTATSQETVNRHRALRTGLAIGTLAAAAMVFDHSFNLATEGSLKDALDGSLLALTSGALSLASLVKISDWGHKLSNRAERQAYASQNRSGNLFSFPA